MKRRITLVYVLYALVVMLLVITSLVCSWSLYDDYYLYADGDVWCGTMSPSYVEVDAYCRINHFNITVDGSNTNNTILVLDNVNDSVYAETEVLRWTGNGSGLTYYNITGLYRSTYRVLIDGAESHNFATATTNISIDTTMSNHTFRLLQGGGIDQFNVRNDYVFGGLVYTLLFMAASLLVMWFLMGFTSMDVIMKLVISFVVVILYVAVIVGF